MKGRDEEIERLTRERDEARAALARLRPVAEAVLKWRECDLDVSRDCNGACGDALADAADRMRGAMTNDHEDDERRCDGCSEPASHEDSDGLPLCTGHFLALLEVTLADAQRDAATAEARGAEAALSAHIQTLEAKAGTYAAATNARASDIATGLAIAIGNARFHLDMARRALDEAEAEVPR